jgi:WD40 repeat protein
MQGHTSHIPTLTGSGDVNPVFSGSFDETIKLWNIDTGNCLETFRAPRPYEQMNIAGISGLTEAEKENLKALGAIER